MWLTKCSIALSLLKLVEYLRSPSGCKWDMEQTHQSLRKNLLEEDCKTCTGDTYIVFVSKYAVLSYQE